MTSAKKVYVSTFGCQMNERDSENMVALLAKSSFIQTPQPDDADLILINTCSIREHASEKAASQLGRFGKMKERRSEQPPVIGITGCLAQQEGKAFLQRFPYVDLIIGPDAIPKLPEMVERVFEARQSNRTSPRQIDTARDLDAPLFLHEYLSYPVNRPEQQGTQKKISAYVIITKGCDFRCTFCVVPNTRGPERSASPEEIIAETRMLSDQGVREVTFLGQNVNSYGKHFTPAVPFAKLLERIEHEIPTNAALQRLRFTTSHPIDLSPELMQAFAELPRLCPHLHLPVQCGDDQVLRRMKRLYNVADYLKKIETLRSFVPDISLTTDIIVGFPGETHAQFAGTLALLNEVRYTQIYAFKYSERPNTPASKLEDDVSEKEKSERLEAVLDLQRKINREQNQARVGTKMKVLVEGKNRNPEKTGFTARAACSRLVHFTVDEASGHVGDLTGHIVEATIESAQDHSLLGRFVPGWIG